jgi:hypothetical protein
MVWTNQKVKRPLYRATVDIGAGEHFYGIGYCFIACALHQLYYQERLPFVRFANNAFTESL